MPSGSWETRPCVDTWSPPVQPGVQNGVVGGYAKARARERIREASRAGLDVASFLDEASSALASAVPNENHLRGPYWYTLDPESRLITSDYGAEGCVRGHEKVPACGHVEVPAGGQLEVPTPR